MAQQIVTGPFRARNIEPGVWQLTACAPSGVQGASPGGQGVPPGAKAPTSGVEDTPCGAEIYLQGVGPEASEVLQGATIAALGFEWHAGGVEVALRGVDGVRYLTTASAIIHQPKAALYESLPLASFDTEAKRFWARVFRLMRIPGGRFLLKYISRNRRRSRAPRT